MTFLDSIHTWEFSGKNTGAGCHFLLQGIFPTPGSNLVFCTAGGFFHRVIGQILPRNAQTQLITGLPPFSLSSLRDALEHFSPTWSCMPVARLCVCVCVCIIFCLRYFCRAESRGSCSTVRQIPQLIWRCGRQISSSSNP